jgi:uncharacterized membrane protein YqaE (UPF0057 family)
MLRLLPVPPLAGSGVKLWQDLWQALSVQLPGISVFLEVLSGNSAALLKIMLVLEQVPQKNRTAAWDTMTMCLWLCRLCLLTSRICKAQADT